MNPQMKKGILEMCVLYLISEENLYGYDILKKMHVHFPEINESAFYAILRRIHKAGLTESYIQEPSLGPKRKYYKMTIEGKIELDKHISDWNNLNNIVTEIGIKAN